ncbi:MAG: glycosyltransferase [Luteitalea sp.]|nr:glycosyltransferase [Luteitalea sp.]
MARFLLTTWPIPGHANPSLAVAHALRDRGHDVAFYTGSRVRRLIEGEGFPVFCFARVDEAALDRVFFDAHDLGWRERWIGQRQRMRDWLVGTLPGQVADQIEAVRAWRPDALLCDSTMWGPYVVVHDLERLPIVILQYQMGCFLPGPDAPPPGFGLPPPRNWRTRGLARAARMVLEMATRDFRDKVNDVRRQYGLPPLMVSPTMQAGRMALYVVTSVPELDYQRGDLPSSVKYVGPCIWNKPHDAPPPTWVAELPRDRPVVHVCEGTVHARRPIVLHAAAQALANAPFHVVMTTGTHRHPESLDLGPLAANIRVEPWVPHTDLFPATDLVVTTGGAGTVLTALRFGIPLLIVPTEWDKPESARRVVESGAGLALSPRRCTPKRLRSAVEQLLTDRRFRDAAQRLARALGERGGANQVATLIEDLVHVPTDPSGASIEECADYRGVERIGAGDRVVSG